MEAVYSLSRVIAFSRHPRTVKIVLVVYAELLRQRLSHSMFPSMLYSLLGNLNDAVPKTNKTMHII